ncbi:MAG: TetR/AcrR family transcriptional regulator [Pseudomonadota bacterium]
MAVNKKQTEKLQIAGQAQKSASARQRILDAASELFLAGGVSRMSARAIAQKAGVSTIGIYSHFNGKQGILDALYIEGFEMVSANMQIEDSNASAEERLITASRRYLAMGENNEAHYQLIFGESDTGYEPSEEAKEVRDRSFNELISAAGSLLAHGASTTEQRQIGIEIWALLHGFVSLKHMAINTNSATASPWDWQAAAIEAVRRLVKTYR